MLASRGLARGIVTRMGRDDRLGRAKRSRARPEGARPKEKRQRTAAEVMPMSEEPDKTTNRAFLEHTQLVADAASGYADEQALKAGERVLASLEGLGSLLELMHGLACCGWGCRGGDHQIEWLLGRVV